MTDEFSPEIEYWEIAWLPKTYGGAPDECSLCFRNGSIVKLDDNGNCPVEEGHNAS